MCRQSHDSSAFRPSRASLLGGPVVFPVAAFDAPAVAVIRNSRFFVMAYTQGRHEDKTGKRAYSGERSALQPAHGSLAQARPPG